MKNNKKKILFLGRFPPPVHGAAVMDEFYYNSIDINREFELRRISINKKGSFNEIGEISLKNVFWFIYSYFKLLRYLITFRPNLVYFEIAPHGIAFYRDSLYVLLCKLFSKNIIFHLHARDLEKNFYSRFIFSNSKMILLSKLLLPEVNGLFKEKDLYFLPNGIPDSVTESDFSKILSKRQKKSGLNIVFLSNMIEEKGTLDLLKICKGLKDKKVKFKATFAGSWTNSKTREKWYSLRASLYLDKECVYVGEKFDEDKKKLFEESNVMVFPTSYKNESFPLVILEAFMLGVPVLSYDTGAIRELISKNYLGGIFPRGDWKEMVRKLENMEFSEKNSKKIREDFKKRYTIFNSEKGLLKIFEDELDRE